MNSVVHFELPAQDRKRMAEFYTKVFGWKAQLLGEDMANYTLVSTTETDEQGMPKRAGAINGGFFQKDPKKPMSQYPCLVIGVEDIKATMKTINDAGGKASGEPMEIPGYGLYLTFMDTEGNLVSMMQPTADWKEKTK